MTSPYSKCIENTQPVLHYYTSLGNISRVKRLVEKSTTLCTVNYMCDMTILFEVTYMATMAQLSSA